jgi:hypothetical protein
VRAGELIAGRYLLEAEVAMGGGGRVFRAHHVADGQLVAVKLGGAASDAVRCYARAAELALEGNDLDSALRSTERARACGAEGPALGALHALSASASEPTSTGAARSAPPRP